MAYAVIDVCGNEFDPKELLDLTGLEFTMYHRNAYQTYIEIDCLSEALLEVGKIVDSSSQQFIMILDADEESEICVDLRGYLIADRHISIPIELFKCLSLISINTSNCEFAN